MTYNQYSKGYLILLILCLSWGCQSDSQPLSLSVVSDAPSESESTDLPVLTLVDQLGSETDTHVGSQLPIYGGVAPSEPYHNAVVALHQRSSAGVDVSPFCSGTLITSTVVLTAAHCLDTAKGGGGNFKTMSPNQLAIYVGNGVAADPNPSIYPVSETLIYSGYNRRNLHNDIALVRLVSAVPSSQAQPVPALPTSLGLTDADFGTSLNFVGFGYDENRNFGVKLQADVPLAGLGCVVSGCSTFGDPLVMFSYAQPSAGPCNGDSGGPAFIFRNGVPYVAGMTSFGDQQCRIYGVSSRADAFETFISNFTGQPPSPNCEADGVCESGCVSDPDCDSVGGMVNGGSMMGGTPMGGMSTGGSMMGGTPMGGMRNGGSMMGGSMMGGSEPPSPECGNQICEVGESCDGRRGTQRCRSDCDGVLNGRPTRRYCFVNGVCEGSGCR